MSKLDPANNEDRLKKRHEPPWHGSYSGILPLFLFNSPGQTVVTNAKHMSGDWKSSGSQTARPGTRVADYVKAGGSNYNMALDNCHDGSKRMMDVAKPKGKR